MKTIEELKEEIRMINFIFVILLITISISTFKLILLFDSNTFIVWVMSLVAIILYTIAMATTRLRIELRELCD